ncbi:MAG: ABC transporter ATP-binding protein [Ancalomicrobiaceae bacterium]|nr:ABC transporter ATP-binding protein [Ancalomicrobiaceae bacterium]
MTALPLAAAGVHLPAPATFPPALAVEGLSKAFGGLTVASGINLTLARGDRVALIGPNGAGKTTFVNLVSGLLSPSAGSISLAGEDITRLSDVQRARRGLVRSFQVSRLFHGLSVREHIELALLQRLKRTNRLFASIGRMADVAHEAAELIERLGLADIADARVDEISYGQQRLTDLAMSLALKPKVLLLDEPAAGVPTRDAGRTLDVVEALPGDIAVLMIEHDMDLVFRFAKRVVVLAAGHVIFAGTPAEIVSDERVRAAYLGAYGREDEPHGR